MRMRQRPPLRAVRDQLLAPDAKLTPIRWAQYAIRSPHPTYHFLRAQDVADAVAASPSAASIPDTNKRRLRELGPGHARAMFEALLAGGKQ